MKSRTKTQNDMEARSLIHSSLADMKMKKLLKPLFSYIQQTFINH